MHHYGSHNDLDGSVLESITTAPLVVAYLINMQYYRFTVDQADFGSGGKTIHSVVGQFGMLSGAPVNLQTRLPIQSLHDELRLFHRLPVPLQEMTAAPRSAISRVHDMYDSIHALVNTGWLNRIAIEGDHGYQWLPQQRWELTAA